MKIPRQSYTLEFKELAVKRVKDVQSFSSVAKELGMNEQTLRNWAGSCGSRCRDRFGNQNRVRRTNGTLQATI